MTSQMKSSQRKHEKRKEIMYYEPQTRSGEEKGVDNDNIRTSILNEVAQYQSIAKGNASIYDDKVKCSRD